MDDDTHLCLRCNIAIIGLDNYISHKRKPGLCVANRVISSTAQSSQLTSTSSYPVCSSEASDNQHLLQSKKTSVSTSEPLFSCTSVYPLTSSYSETLTNSQALSVVNKATGESLLSTCSPSYPSPSRFSLSPASQILSSSEKSATNDTLLTTCTPRYSFGLSPVTRPLSAIEKAASDALLVACSNYPSPSFGLGSESQHLSTDGKTTDESLLTTCSNYPSPSSFGLSPVRQTLPSDGKPSSDTLLSTCSPSYPSPSCYDIYSRASDFFSSLELQCKSKTAETPSGRDEQNAKDALSPNSLFISPNMLDQEGGVQYLGSDSESVDYFPPHFHTGGKWKPGCQPDALSNGNQLLPFTSSNPRNSPPRDQFSVIDKAIRDDVFGMSYSQSKRLFASKKVWPLRHSIKGSPYGKKNMTEKSNRLTNDAVPFSMVTRKHVKASTELKQRQTIEHSRKELVCSYCAEQFSDKLSVVQHMFHAHWAKADCEEHMRQIILHRNLLLKVLPFQCLICLFYCNKSDDLLSHIRNKNHLQKTAQLKNPLICTACEYECRGSDDLIGHMMSKEHKKRESLVVMIHPVTIATSKMMCDYCIDKCALHSTHLFKNLSRSKGSGRPCVPAVIKSNKLEPKDTATCSPNGPEILEDTETMANGNKVLTEETPCPDNSTFLGSGNSEGCLEETDKMCDLLLNVINETVGNLEKDLSSIATVNEESTFEEGLHTERENSEDTSSENTEEKVEISVKELTLPQILITEATNIDLVGAVITVNEEPVVTVNGNQIEENKNKVQEDPNQQEMSEENEQPNFKCKTCQKTFTHKSGLDLHVKQHLGLKDLKCDQCEFTTSRKFILARHKLRHLPEQPKPFLCEQCGYSAHTLWALKLHSKTHSQSSLPFKCDFDGCPFSFRWKSELRYHKHVHLNKRPFKCDICSYAGKTVHQLTQHMRSHTGDRPFKCRHCNYSAALSNQLIRHMRTHSGFKPYQCPYCDYVCNTQENIRKHILKTKKHSGKKMYPCHFCGFSCNDFKEYQKHSLLEHPGEFPRGYKDILSSETTGLYVRNQSKTTDRSKCLEQQDAAVAEEGKSSDSSGFTVHHSLVSGGETEKSNKPGSENRMSEEKDNQKQCENSSQNTDTVEANCSVSSSELENIVYLESELNCLELAIESDCLNEAKMIDDCASTTINDVTTKRLLIFVQ